MKLNFIFVFILFIVTQQFSLKAQTTNSDPLEKNYRFGILLEYQGAKVNFVSEAADDYFRDKTAQSFGIGIMGEYKLAKNFFISLQPKILFSDYNLTFEDGGVETETLEENINIQLPIYAIYEFSNDSKFTPTVSLGYAFDINIVDPENDISLSPPTFHELLAEVGFSVQTSFFTWSPYFGMNTSLSNVMDIQLTDVNGDNLNSDNRRLGFHAGVRFKG